MSHALTREQVAARFLTLKATTTNQRWDCAVSLEQHEAALQARIAALEQENRERKDGFLEMALQWRGVELASACQECQGSGVKAYANTTIWHGGAGGQAITNGVCNQCWGSGDRYHTWVNLKHEASQLATAQARIAALEQDQRVRIEALHTLRTGYDATVAQLEARLAALVAERDQAQAMLAQQKESA